MKSPRQLVISAYVDDAGHHRQVVTPDLKPARPRACCSTSISAAAGSRLGGSALAQVFGQIGDESPDMDDPGLLAPGVRRGPGADRPTAWSSPATTARDGGLVTTLLEMAFAGNCGIDVDLRTEGAGADPLAVLFAEELGLVLEVEPDDLDEALAVFAET